MPLWKIYHPEDAYTQQDKQEIAESITQMYQGFLPRFYVNVFFRALPKDSFFIGAEPCDDFVRVSIDHIARSLKDAAAQKQFLMGCNQVLHPYIAGRGYRWELHVNETPFDLWTVNGFKPPLPETAAEQNWRAENKPSAYDL